MERFNKERLELRRICIGDRVLVARGIRVRKGTEQVCMHIGDEVGFVVGMGRSHLRLCNKGPVGELKPEFSIYRERVEDIRNQGYVEWRVPYSEINECQKLVIP